MELGAFCDARPPNNHHSSLATLQTLMRVPRLGYAASVPSTSGTDVFNGAAG